MPWTNGFHWIAYYDPADPPLDQRQGATYADIDRERLTAFGLYNGDKPLILVDFRDESVPDIGPKRLIWRMRHQMSSNGTHTTIHLVGWQRKIAGRNVQAIAYINEEGTVILGGQWDDKKSLHHPIAILECEQDLT